MSVAQSRSQSDRRWCETWCVKGLPHFADCARAIKRGWPQKDETLTQYVDKLKKECRLKYVD